jgi:ribosomal protein S18 acetylase RimI-like enzyme
MNLSIALEIGVPEAGEAERIIAIARDAGVFSTEEVDVVQELVQEHFQLGAERSGYYFIVARDERDLLGFACYGPRPLTIGTFDLYWIVVAPRLGQRGIGTILLERVTHDVRTAGGRLLVAETSGLPAYLPAREFYDRHRFMRVASIADFYAPGDDLVLFVKGLDQCL